VQCGHEGYGLVLELQLKKPTRSEETKNIQNNANYTESDFKQLAGTKK
jgi:hypothetical protein